MPCPANELEGAELFEKTGRPITGWFRLCQEITPGTACCAPTKNLGLQQLLKNSVKRDGVGGDGAWIRAGGELGERARARALLEDFDFAVVHGRAGIENVVVAG